MIRAICFVLFICGISAKSIIVSTSSGDVRGKFVRDEITGATYYSFTGIPYAEAPVGELRFQPPVPKQPWDGVFDATKQGCVCPQREEFYTRDQMDEDCLVYNVYVPANKMNKTNKTNKLIPVLFHIHAGHLDSLSGNPEPIFGPGILVKEMMIVTLNYRLGPLGFLSLRNKAIPGNAGLKDVVLLAKTIRENIINFGGDPKRITVCGNAASGAIAEWLMHIDETKDMFFSAMLKSGSFFNSKYMQMNPKENAMSLVREMNIDYDSEADLVEQLKCADPFDLVEATEAMIMKDPQRGCRIASPFTLVVEKKHKHAVITESPAAIMKRGAISDIPLLIGCVSQEGAEILPVLRKEPHLIDTFNEDFTRMIPREFAYPEGCKERRELGKQMKKIYFNESLLSMATTPNMVDFMSDTQYFFPVDLFVRYFIKTKKSNVFYYMYGPDTELNYAKAQAGFTYPGCTRNDETGYEFITAATKPMYKKLSRKAKNFQDFSTKVFKHFIQFGKPPPLPETWPNAGPNLYWADVETVGSVVVYERPLSERMRFWSTVHKEFCDSKYSAGSLFC